ncbi:MAG: amidohydrolase family protein [Bryobacteraceae bacterium]|nr:amidohydrolase family protein [Bryobacteraceae bacterium]
MSARLPLNEFDPRSMLQARVTKIEKSRFPAIDIHTHLSWGDVLAGEQKVTQIATPEEILAVMDRKNIRLMVNLTGGYGKGLEECVRYWSGRHPERFLIFTEPWYSRIAEAGYAQFQADELERARKAGARGVKILMTLGLGLREKVTSGRLIKVDDPRFDPMWEAAGALGMPVAIHTSAPEAFFLPVDRYNERYEELAAHPDWSFHGGDFPAERELEEARNRVTARHPRTQFLVLHVGLAENLGYMSSCLDRYPNMLVEFGARISELGRQFRTARKFFDKYQDRILFGTDAVPHGEKEYPQQVFSDGLYEIYYRFLETEDEYFDYSTAPTPPQGRWRIYGLGLPDGILRKVYHDNAARLLGL